MQEIELTWPRILKMWWLMMWRGALMGLPAGFVAGATLGAILALLHLPIIHNPGQMHLVGQSAGVLASLPI